MHIGNPLQGFAGRQGIPDRNRIPYEQDPRETRNVRYGRERMVFSLGAARSYQVSEQAEGEGEAHDEEGEHHEASFKGALTPPIDYLKEFWRQEVSGRLRNASLL